jgi:membrane associated rhomboid family serine protease
VEGLPVFLPYSVDVPMERLPIANWVLIAVTSFISLGILFGPKRSSDLDPDWNGIPPNISDKEAERIFRERLKKASQDEDHVPALALQPRAFSLFQLVGHVFVHGNLLHLIGNMFFLFVFGNAVNAKLGQLLFLACYFLLGVLGGCAWLVFGNGLPMVGASGAIMGLIGVFLVYFPRNEVTVLYYGFGSGGEFSLSSYWLILFYMGCDLYGTLRGNGGVAYVTHLGGTLAGLGLGIVFVSTGLVTSTDYEENLLQALGWQEKIDRYGDLPKAMKKRKKKPRD